MTTFRFVILGCGLLLLAGCGNSGDSLMKQQIRAMNDLADAMEKDRPESELAKIKERMDDIGDRAKKLDLSVEEQKKLLEKHGEALKAATARVMKATMGKAMGDFGKVMGGGGMPNMPMNIPGMPKP